MDPNDTPNVTNPRPLSSYLKTLHDTCSTPPNFHKSNVSTYGEPIFTKSDVFRVNQSLAQMLRYICVMHNITWQELKDKTNLFAYQLNITSRDLGVLHGNLKKEVKKDKISFNKLEQIVSSILGYSIEDLTLTIKDNSTGQTYVHSLSDIATIIQDDPDVELKLKQVL